MKPTEKHKKFISKLKPQIDKTSNDNEAHDVLLEPKIDLRDKALEIKFSIQMFSCSETSITSNYISKTQEFSSDPIYCQTLTPKVVIGVLSRDIRAICTTYLASLECILEEHYESSHSFKNHLNLCVKSLIGVPDQESNDIVNHGNLHAGTKVTPIYLLPFILSSLPEKISKLNIVSKILDGIQEYLVTKVNQTKLDLFLNHYRQWISNRNVLSQRKYSLDLPKEIEPQKENKRVGTNSHSNKSPKKKKKKVIVDNSYDLKKKKKIDFSYQQVGSIEEMLFNFARSKHKSDLSILPIKSMDPRLSSLLTKNPTQESIDHKLDEITTKLDEIKEIIKSNILENHESKMDGDNSKVSCTDIQ